AEVQATSKSSLTSPGSVPAGVGAETANHLLPVQCRIWSSLAPSPFSDSPTAQQFDGEVQRTASSWSLSSLPAPAGSGTVTANHFLPVQCSTWFSIAPL